MATQRTLGDQAEGRLAALRRRLPGPLALFSALCLAGAAFVAGWALIVDDPLGGEPQASLSLNAEPPAPAGGDQSAPALRAPVSASEAETTREAPTEQNLPGGAKIISLGDSRSSSGDRTDLQEESRYGALPKIALDGTMPFRAYARPAPPLDRSTPRIAVVIGGMGLSTVGTETAIRNLPEEITLAFAPYGRDLERLTDLARQSGHEMLLQVPMEPFDYPNNDPGPHTLLTGLSQRQNLDRLYWVMGRFTGYIGIANYQGAQFSTVDGAMEPLFRELRNRGIGYFDDGSAPQSVSATLADRLGLGYAKADVVIDAETDPAAIESALKRLEDIARNRGTAVGAASALPVTIKELGTWSRELAAEGIALVPLSAAMRDMR
ncbi:MAG: divergent polysaccharide deacetylase family protein [Rhodobiaceae bacterium]|nr:divergent polysaccharide deacetylase family protein [Rhodobiaceae bacterium]MCC0056714.1 divergent polysaccharide deacetylase family protein [Rhodobiaceae bacterium]